ncbi:MAG: hypothetical protein V4643_09995 [Bacteroidota bacterium]
MFILQKRIVVLFFATVLLVASCSLPKETLQRVNTKTKETIDLPLEYANLFPPVVAKGWDDFYDTFDSYLTADIMKTQMGLSYEINNVQVWWCTPAARTHVQLDTATMIKDNSLLLGEWRAITNRTVTYYDSALIKEEKIIRSAQLVNENKTDDVLLLIDAQKCKLFNKAQRKTDYIRVFSKNYAVENKRYLLLYGLSKDGAAVAFIGIDKDGQLILNNYYVEERKVKGQYMIYEATMHQLVFKRVEK